MFGDIAQYVRRCKSCQEYKLTPQKIPGKMQPSDNTLPWHTVSTDIVGPLPRSSRGNVYLTVFQDRFTKWVQCRAIRKPTAKVVTKALYEEVITKFGCPNIVITDNGTQYTGKIFKDFLQEMGISHRLTPPYTPQANPVERTNKTLKTMIAQFCENDHRKWDTHLPSLTFAINTAKHESTGFSPAYLNFGREPEIPNAVYRRTDRNNEIVTDDEGQVRAQSEHLRTLKEVYELVRVHLARAQATQSHHYDLRRREWRCRLGDQVMKREHTLSSADKGVAAKLSPKYSGPYTVVKVHSPVVYDLKAENGRKLNRLHIKDLKPLINNISYVPDGRPKEETNGEEYGCVIPSLRSFRGTETGGGGSSQADGCNKKGG